MHSPNSQQLRRALPRALALSAALSLGAASAQESIIIGASLPLSGSQAAAGKEGQAIMQAQIDAFNREGGVGGRKLSLKLLDDGYDPQRAAANARALAEQGAVALLNCWGTASCAAMQPELERGQTPLVGAIAGAGPLRQQPGRLVYPLRASTRGEINAMLQQIQTLGQSRIAIVYQQDSFGQSSLDVAHAVLKERGMSTALELAVDASGSNAQAAVQQLVQADPAVQAIIVLAGASATIHLVTQARQAQLQQAIYNLAAQANQAVVKGLGSHTRGIVFTTLVPSPWRTSVPAVKSYQQLLGASGMPQPSYLGLEVFINTQALLDGLRKAGPGVQRSNLPAALEALGELRYGHMQVRLAAPARTGSSYVGLAMIDQSGQFRE
ncbi:MAG: ABC transporter substrate-binding protein [Comamonas sp.]|jgi:ABC-type branched-subunit amino acid transport system substrate-binding protein|uniref:ABC transporter substrate-binding protein n=1 Tax=Comamonas sp. TaxID=34028 RepID=UPI0028189C81|nr:ABC transporter substrate-binding protein [Comamonas sp.]MDR0214302.1 ABC transporter substrate-binding protein [Comamonas sp.]